MYTTFLILHSWLRWLALLAGLGATAAALLGGDPRRADRWGLWLTIALDVQLLIGLLLYFVVSPNMQIVRDHFAESMRTPGLRFWAVEHVGMMLIAVVCAHIGRVQARKARNVAARRRRQLIWFGLATLFMLLGMPWPGTVSGRPLFRLS